MMISLERSELEATAGSCDTKVLLRRLSDDLLDLSELEASADSYSSNVLLRILRYDLYYIV